MGDLETGDAGGDPARKRLIRVGCPDVQKGVAAFRCEHLRDDSFNRRVFADVRCCEIGWDDGRGLTLKA